MANNPKEAKKVATKSAKVHGSPKVPKYEQKETASNLAVSTANVATKGKK
ncbi:hypothetical protein [Spirosoma agri]|nr:hypothetical protein [Spirosoma agri]